LALPGGSDLERLVLVGSDLEYLFSLPQDRLLTHTAVMVAAASACRTRRISLRRRDEQDGRSPASR
jgi:hypothetical protein